MFKSIYTFILSIILLTNTLYSIEDNQIPPSLLQWKGWVLDDVVNRDCPIDYKSANPQCVWFPKISVSLNGDRLDFNMSVKLYRDKIIVPLPMANLSWVRDVIVDGKKGIVLENENRANIILKRGMHLIKGYIPYKNSIKYLQLPSSVALVEFYKNGKKVSSIKIDQKNRLWLDEDRGNRVDKGSLSVSIYRKLIDGHPMRMQTYLHFAVSGKMRSVVMDGILVDGFLPTAINTTLNTTITEDKRLEVEIKAGEWTVLIDSYNPKNITQLQKPKYNFKYANQEVWSFQSAPNYRTIDIEGVTPIDPSQTTVPSRWKKLPAYLVEDKSNIELKELYKSAKQQQKNEFRLHRELWLDFDGGGYTISDTINAKISQVKRLESTNLLDLASISINNKPTLITKVEKSSQKGVELREKNMKIEASSRYEGDISNLPANGWDEKFDSINTTLNLPIGWRLFASFGSDNRPSAWIDKWNLMDIFLLLLITIAIYQLYGVKWSILSIIFLTLLWHESNAPTTIWLTLLALIAIFRILDEGRLKKVIKFIMIIVIAIITLKVLSFSIYEIRTALYPQLEKRDYTVRYSVGYEAKGISYDKEESLQSPRKKVKISNISNMVNINSYPSKRYVKKSYKQIMQNRIDPNAVVQTGIGKPKWRWESYRLSWQSGVGKTQKLELWLISPTMNKFIKIFNIMGMLFLLYMFLQEFIKPKLPTLKNGKNIALILLIFILPYRLNANDIPSESMLNKLRDKLTTAPICLPNCASMQNMELIIKDNRVKIIMNISAGADISIPLLGNRNIWLPQKVIIDNNLSQSLNLDSSGGLWTALKRGIHRVELIGSIEGHNQISLSSLLPIRNFTSIVKNGLWRVTSDKKSYIEINTLNKADKKAKEKSKIEPKVEIKRTFYFGQRWYIDTDVKLLNKIDKPYIVYYDLLRDESILDKEIEVKDGRAILHLSNKQSSYKWRSSIPIVKKLELKATNKNQILETWQMDISSIWDMKYTRIEPIEQVNINNILMPKFKPWQSEKLILSLERAKAVKGATLTIESTQLKILQSSRYRDITLNIDIKSSQATQYIVTLKDVKELKPTLINGKTHYLKIDKNRVSIPLQAKKSKIKLSWREERTTDENYQFPNINLGKNSVNSNIQLSLPYHRLVLWTDGPTLGPAVLIWGTIFAILLFSIILGRVKETPLKSRDWLLLGVGVSSASVMIMLPVIIWIFALKFREHKADELKGWARNLTQIGLVLLTLIALATIIGAVSAGLLGNPDMMITGNNSSAHYLNWYSDRIIDIPKPTVITISIWYYRALMLLWSIWIAFSLIKWLKWAWGIFTQGDIWVKREKKKS